MAVPKVFFDANILLYTDDPRLARKQKIAAALIELHWSQKSGVVSIQVLQEYFRNAAGKMGLGAELARQRTIFFSKFILFQPSLDDVFGAIDLYRLHGLAYWDAAILRAAIQSGTSTLYTEDFQHGRRIDGVEIVNPFL
jgi:predicted nucleic acid-binding protein